MLERVCLSALAFSNMTAAFSSLETASSAFCEIFLSVLVMLICRGFGVVYDIKLCVDLIGLMRCFGFMV